MYLRIYVNGPTQLVLHFLDIRDFNLNQAQILHIKQNQTSCPKLNVTTTANHTLNKRINNMDVSSEQFEERISQPIPITASTSD